MTDAINEGNLLNFIKEGSPYIWELCYHFKMGESALRNHLKLLLIKGSIRMICFKEDGRRKVKYEVV